jgi:2-C-methyl-D-erythritol 4-phosphate cytidylyltransferase
MPLPSDPPRIFALVPCAGSGQRAGVGQPKQYVALAGASLVAHTLRRLEQVTRLTQILVVLSPGDSAFAGYAPNFTGWVADVGGTSRAESVRHGLRHLFERGAQPSDWVLVHDAARCLVQATWVDGLIDACWDDPVGGLLALPVADTLKRSKNDALNAPRVDATLNRLHLWQAQTPQMFRLGMLHTAMAHAGPELTDEASAMEAAGYAPKLVQGHLENFKITYPSDFALAERILIT